MDMRGKMWYNIGRTFSCPRWREFNVEDGNTKEQPFIARQDGKIVVI